MKKTISYIVLVVVGVLMFFFLKSIEFTTTFERLVSIFLCIAIPVVALLIERIGFKEVERKKSMFYGVVVIVIYTAMRLGFLLAGVGVSDLIDWMIFDRLVFTWIGIILSIAIFVTSRNMSDKSKEVIYVYKMVVVILFVYFTIFTLFTPW